MAENAADGGAVVAANGAAVADGAAAAEGQPAAGGGAWSMIKGLAFRMMVIYFISSLIRNWRQPAPSATNESGSVGAPMPPSKNIFGRMEPLDVYVYLSESGDTFKDFDDASALFWMQPLFYGDWTAGAAHDGLLVHSARIPCTPHLQRNGSIFLHAFVVKSDASPNPKSHSYLKRFTLYRSKQLNKFKKKRYQKTSNLLTGKTEASDEDRLKAETLTHEVLSHWHPNLTINLVDDHTAWTKGSLPAPLDEYVQFEPVTGDYYPIFFFNDYWNLGQEYQPVNETVEWLELTLTLAPMSLFKWQMYASQQMRSRWTSLMGGELFDDGGDDDQDSLKQAMLETNPYLLGVTVCVSILHTVFEFLAFKNDIQFWRSRKSLEGLSVRSVLFNVLTSLIVLLYIIDNETNFVVKASVFVGMLIELWKIPKCMDVSLDRDNPLFGVLPRVRFADKGSYVDSSTKQYDQLAFRYLSWLLYPLLGGYAVYSLMYVEQRGWYSWVLSMLYGFLLTFGFIMMTPQLVSAVGAAERGSVVAQFINYKLKSVAHLPWRMLSYKFINTFIDDLFAFVIRMPMMYRIGCFRDDIVFLVYVYQRWIYRVDPKRVNEFGTTGEDHAAGPVDAAIAAADDQAPVAAVEEAKKDK